MSAFARPFQNRAATNVNGADRAAQLETLLNRTPLGICLVDAHLQIQEINAAAVRAMGEAPGGFIGRSIREVAHALWDKAYADEIAGAFQRTLETGEPYVAKERSARRTDKSGTERYEWRLDRVAFPDGSFGVACYLQDVSEQRRAALAVERLASIVESSDDAIASKDLDGVITSWNQGAERLFGYTAAEIIGKHVSTLIPPDRLDEEPGILERIRRGDRVDHYETVRRRKDGTLIDISLTVSPVRDSTGKVVGASKIARDISLRKQADATQQLLLNELNHRVKNTLATVQAIVQQTLRRTKDPAAFAAQFSGRIQSLARVHAQLTHTTWQGADLKELIHDQLIRGAVDEARLMVRGPAVRLGPQMATHLALMLHELGTNAVKYGAFSNEDGRVSIAWSVRDNELHLTWAERDGPAVAAPSGRGFGSLLIEQSARSGGGEAEMLCEVEGVTWEIRMPLSQADKRRMPQVPRAPWVRPRPVEIRTGPDPVLAGRRLLVIEDEPLIALEIGAYLDKAGADIAHHAGTEEEALQAIEANDFDGALLDANLQGCPVDRIASALTRRGAPFLFVTGYGRAGLPASFRQAPMLAKPFSEQELISAVAGVVSRPQGVVELKN
jgi:PAS domain S-box-containing protein